MADEEAELVRHAQGGSIAAFDQLVRRYQPPLMHLLTRRLRRVADAEDVLQETFVRAYAKLHQYDPRWAFRTWVFTIACRLADRWQSRRRPAAGLGDDHAARSASPPDAAGRREEHAALWDIARAVLGDDEFTALWLHYGQQLPLDEVAAVQGRSLGSVKVMLHRARHKLEPRVRHLRPDAAVREG